MRGFQAVLVGLAMVSGVLAARTEATDLAASNRWTVVMLAAIIALPLGGLVWWVRPDTPPALRKRERARTIGRWARSVLASGGLTTISVGIIVERDGLALFGLLLLALSPFGYLVCAAIGKRTVPAWEWPGPAKVDADATAAVTAVRETLVEPPEQQHVYGGSMTIRPHATEPTPAGMDGWLRNGALSTDGTTLTVTDRSGRSHRVPLASVTGLLVLRESVVASGGSGASVPRLREALCVLDPAGRRLLDVELYGWSGSDLVGFARVAGLRLDRYAPTNDQAVVPNLRGATRTAFDKAFPRVPGHRTIRGRGPWREALLLTGVVLLTMVLYYVGLFTLTWAMDQSAVPDPWRAILSAALAIGLLTGLLAVIRRAGLRYESRRRAARARPYDAI